MEENVFVFNEYVTHVFCATGPGGGVDPTCPGGNGGGGGGEGKKPAPLDESKFGPTKPAGMKTGNSIGKVGYIPISKIDFQGQRLEEVTPLRSNDSEPVIVKKHKDKYRIVDGFGRTNGLANAGEKRVRVILVTDKDLSKRTTGGDDEEWNEKIYKKYVPHLGYPGTTN